MKAIEESKYLFTVSKQEYEKIKDSVISKQYLEYCKKVSDKLRNATTKQELDGLEKEEMSK